MPTKIQDNLKAINAVFDGTSDLVIREFMIGSEVKAFIVMIAGLVNEASINENLIKPLLFVKRELNTTNAFSAVKETMLAVAHVKEGRTLDEAVDAVLSGDTALFIDGSGLALIASVRGWETRGVDEPKTEAVVRGPREGFVE